MSPRVDADRSRRVDTGAWRFQPAVATRLLTNSRNRPQMAALYAVPGPDLLHERRFALGESSALLPFSDSTN
jgi:hypothetical protein